jgi:hypothetical protein
MAKKAAIVWEQQEDGSWLGKENTFYPREWHLVQDDTVTHRTRITEARDPMQRPSLSDWPNYDVAKRAIARRKR